MTSSLPPSVLALAELSPIEDLLLPILRAEMPDMRIASLIADDQGFPFVLVRRAPTFGDWDGDTRFVDVADITVHCFAYGINADSDAALLAEAVRVVLRNAGLTNRGVPGRGHITGVQMTSAPRRASDWATATGPVQYADLPSGVSRYETLYRIRIRKPRTLSIY